jgi:cytochrome c
LAASALAASAHAWALPDAVRGEQVYARCLACHALAVDRVGPRHCGLFGRLAGSVPGFGYSEAMKKSKIVWNDKTPDRFLTKPQPDHERIELRLSQRDRLGRIDLMWPH